MPFELQSKTGEVGEILLMSMTLWMIAGVSSFPRKIRDDSQTEIAPSKVNGFHHIVCQPPPPGFLRKKLGPHYDVKKMAEENPNRRQRNKKKSKPKRDKRSIGVSSDSMQDSVDDIDTHRDTLSESLLVENVNVVGESVKKDKDFNDSAHPPFADNANITSRKNYRYSRHDVNDTVPSGRHPRQETNGIITNATARRLHRHARNAPSRKNNKRRWFEKVPKIFRSPPWECKMEPKWIKMKPGEFPEYILSGKCQQKTCMNKMYKCAPKRYVIKVLKRDNHYCNPLPSISSNTTYEQVWSFHTKKIVVCCDCKWKARKTNYVTPKMLF